MAEIGSAGRGRLVKLLNPYSVIYLLGPLGWSDSRICFRDSQFKVLQNTVRHFPLLRFPVSIRFSFLVADYMCAIENSELLKVCPALITNDRHLFMTVEE